MPCVQPTSADLLRGKLEDGREGRVLRDAQPAWTGYARADRRVEYVSRLPPRACRLPRGGPYTRKGSFGSDVRMILKVTLALRQSDDVLSAQPPSLR